MERSARYPATLLAAFVLWWCLLAYAPAYRQDWLLENLLVLIVVPLLVWSYPRLRLSDFSYTLLFVFFCVHEVGAHYTYAEVPYAAWYARLTGSALPAIFAGGRNHFDRLVHFLYGLLVLPAVIELLQARATPRGLWRNLLPVVFIMSNSELFELIEWQAAEIFGGPLGQAYLGTQGDIWDAQKDSAMAALGAVLGLVLYRLRAVAQALLIRQATP